MLARIDFLLENKNLNERMGSVFHGFIMEQIESDYANFLHSSNDNPYSQYLFFDKLRDSYVWRINTLTEEAYEKIILRLKDINLINIKQKQLSIEVKEKIQPEITNTEKLATEIYSKSNVEKIGIKFLTPTSFKSRGKYENYPRLPLFYGSLMRKINKFSPTIKAGDLEVVDFLSEKTWISRYNLMSTTYNVESVKINAFKGYIYLHIKANDEIKRLIFLFAKYGEYSGVGIKTALGMGGIIVE